MRLLTMICAGAALCACQAGEAPPLEAAGEVDEAADIAAIETLIDRMEAGWKAGNGEAFAEPFAQDAYFTTWFGLRIDGRPGVAEGHQGIFDSVYAGTQVIYSVKDARLLDEDVALVWLDGWVAPADAAGPEGEAQVHPLLVAVRGEGGWEVAAFQNTPVQEPGAMGL